MAQSIYCDAGGDPHLADVMLSQLDGSSTTAFCQAHYLELIQAIVAQLDQAEADNTAAQAEARLADAGQVAEPPTSSGSSDVADPPPGPAGNDGDAPEPAETDARAPQARSPRSGRSRAPAGDPGASDS